MDAFLSRAFRETKERAELLSDAVAEQKRLPELTSSIEAIQRRLGAIANDAGEYAGHCRGVGGLQARTRDAALSASYIREYHRISRDLRIIEEQFVGHIVRFHKADSHLTAVAAKLWAELNLPGDPPVVVGSTSNYYNTFPALNIAFTPFSAASSDLTIPDLVHEFGHLVHRRHRPLFGSRTTSAIHAYGQQLRAKSQQIQRPVDSALLGNIEGVWKKSWAEEVACDSLAVLLLGPSYGWCNLLLCLKNTTVSQFGSHPADMSRTEHLLRVLRRCGFDSPSDVICGIWNQYLKSISVQKPPYYDDFHTEELFIAVLEDVEQNIQQMGLRNHGPIVSSLQENWDRFVRN